MGGKKKGKGGGEGGAQRKVSTTCSKVGGRRKHVNT